jgi:hypothetical protein
LREPETRRLVHQRAAEHAFQRAHQATGRSVEVLVDRRVAHEHRLRVLDREEDSARQRRRIAFQLDQSNGIAVGMDSPDFDVPEIEATADHRATTVPLTSKPEARTGCPPPGSVERGRCDEILQTDQLGQIACQA